MNATPNSHNFSLTNPVRPLVGNENRSERVKSLSNYNLSDAHGLRRWFSEMLWRAFPSASANELSLKAAQALDVTPRQVMNWLKCENDPKLRYVMAVITLAGAEIVFDRMEK